MRIGAYEIVTVEVENEGNYLVPNDEGGFEIKTFTQGQTIQIVRPQDADSIKHSLASSGGGGDSEKSEPWVNSIEKFYNTYE